MKYTSAVLNKMLRRLDADKEFYEERLEEARTYVAAVGETPVIPEFDFEDNSAKIEEIDLKVTRIKHAINLNNALSEIDVDGSVMSADQILVRMAQLTKRLKHLDVMRKKLPKSRVSSFAAQSQSPEYEYINYDLGVVKAEYERVSKLLTSMQIALDKFNQTCEFEVEGI